MRQEQFIQSHQGEWQALEDWLQIRASRPRKASQTRRDWRGLADEDVPAAYRRLCHQLALARRRGYSPALLARLQALMQAGHAVMYRPPAPRWSALPQFLGSDFPRLVRAEWRCMAAAAVLFAVPLLAMFLVLQWRPDLVHSVMSLQQVAELEAMYDPAAEHQRIGRSSGSDMEMFGYYVLNNISIGLRTFASGLVAGLGTVLVLLFNGVVIGSAAGHLQQVGMGDTFWRFVAGHSSLELSAIVIAGGAGLQLGLRLLAPGNRRRIDALVEGGRRGGLLCLGVFAMLLLAAFVEAFWSSLPWVPAPVKYAVGIGLWLVVLVWLLRGGRAHGPWPEHATEGADAA